MSPFALTLARCQDRLVGTQRGDLTLLLLRTAHHLWMAQGQPPYSGSATDFVLTMFVAFEGRESSATTILRDLLA